MNLRDKVSCASRIFRKDGPPIQLTFFVTSRCNLRCSHCFYWKELDSEHNYELTLDEIEKITKSLPRLLALSLTGGEPFIREDIGEIYSLFAKNTRAHIITISTNGFYKERMYALIPKMLSDFPDTNLFIYLSIDGPQEINDKIRGKGSYAKALQTLEMLQPLRKQFKNLGLSISMTCNKTNQDYLQDTFSEFIGSGLTDNVNIAFVRGNPKDPTVKEVSLNKYKQLTELRMSVVNSKKLKYFNFFMSKFISSKDYYVYKSVKEVLEHGHGTLPCQAGSLMGILYDDGKVFPCEVLGDCCLGNIRDFGYDLPKLWTSAKAETVRKRVKNGCYCTFECAMSPSILFNPKYLAKICLKTLLPARNN